MKNAMLKWTLAGVAMSAVAVLVAIPAAAQTVSLYKGSLAIGFGDPENAPGGSRVQPAVSTLVPDFANNGLPACANANPFAPATIAVQPMTGFAVQGAGAAPRSVMFEANAPINIGAQTGGGPAPKTVGTCRVIFPPWLGNQLRSRAQQGSNNWPGYKYESPLPTSPPFAITSGVGGGTFSAGGGLAAEVATLATGFYATGSGMQTLAPGPNAFGGGVPINLDGDVQLGINTKFTNATGQPLATFGVRGYADGKLPTGPSNFGTDAQQGAPGQGIQGSNAYTWLLRTPGATTTNMAATPLAVQLPFTADFGWQQGNAVNFPIGSMTSIPVSTMGAFVGLFQKWTTGQVAHTDMSGMYVTDRTATGHDWSTGQFASNSTAAEFGTTRKLQLVTPWSASIRKLGTGPFAAQTAALPDFGFGGIAILTFDLQPAPEPTSAAMLAIGTAGLVGLGALRRRRA
jgi:hypothetical protein